MGFEVARMITPPTAGPIRPPSEAHSLLIRVTNNCPWNRCRFCTTYKGEKFQLRSVDEIKQDIKTAGAIMNEMKELAWKSGYGDKVRSIAGKALNSDNNPAVRNVALWLYEGGESAFLQDANSIIMRTDELAEVIRFLKDTIQRKHEFTNETGAWDQYDHLADWLVQLGCVMDLEGTALESTYLDAVTASFHSMSKTKRFGKSWDAYKTGSFHLPVGHSVVRSC